MRSELWAVLAVVTLLLISSFMIPIGGPEDMELELRKDGETAALHYSLPGHEHEYPASVMAFPIEQYRHDDITMLLDIGGADANASNPANVQGLMDHLGAELQNIGSSREVKVIDQNALASFFLSGNGTLILASSLWDDIELCHAAEAWVLAGGLLVSISPGSVPFTSEVGGTLQLHFSSLDYDSGRDVSATPFSQAFGWRTVAPIKGLLVKDVLDASGTVLGPIYHRGMELTTMALIPYGQGAVLVLGGPMDKPFRASMEDVFAWDLARCLEAEVAWAIGEPTFVRVSVGSAGAQGSVALDTADNSTYSLIGQNLDDTHLVFLHKLAEI